jgi:hypothetical protein
MPQALLPRSAKVRKILVKVSVSRTNIDTLQSVDHAKIIPRMFWNFSSLGLDCLD